MKDQWGRVESQAWPSDKPVWTRSVCWISVAVVCAALWLQYQTWTPLQRYWLLTYLSARISPIFRAPVSTYRLMLVLHPDGTGICRRRTRWNRGPRTQRTDYRFHLRCRKKPGGKRKS